MNTAATTSRASRTALPPASGSGSNAGTASIEALNAAWGTAFWSQRYAAWDQILPPRRSGTSVNPTQQLDFARYSSDELLECYRAEAAILARTRGTP